MEKYTGRIKGACGVWLALVCLLTLPLWGVVYAAPVLLAYAIAWRKDWCSQVAVAAGCVSLLFMCYVLWEYACWKAEGNWDAQEAIGFLFLFIYQCGISLAAMVLTWCFCAGYRNLSRPCEK